MGQTLENGIYLPSEGERNCYNGLASNWRSVDTNIGYISALRQAIAGALTRKIVTELPTEDIDPNCIYMILKTTPQTNNVYNEWMFINNNWELIGDTQLDLSDYYTKQEVDGKLLLKANDNAVVHNSGAETVAGIKSFSDDTYIKSLNFTNEVASPSSSSSAIMPLVTTVTYTDQTASKVARINLRITASGDKSLYPHENNQYALGLTSRKWSEVHAISYYYGSSDVEFSTKFVTSDTNQNITGTKTFNSDLTVANTDTTANTPNLTLRNYKADRGTTDTAVQAITFLDKNSKALTMLESRKISNGNTATNILCYNTDDSNNTVSGGVAIIKSKTDTNFAPSTDNAVTCGRSLARWSGVYSTEYYYGANNTPFTDKFITSDTNQTITGSKTFSSNVNVYNSDSTANVSNLILKNSIAERGVATNTQQTIYFTDKNDVSLGFINCGVTASAVAQMVFRAFDTNNQSGGFSIRKTVVGTYIQPNTDNSVYLGTNDGRWKGVNTYLVNGLTPSSLSLPDIDNRIDISSYITDLTGVNNEYTPTVNGWICVRSGNATKISILDSGTNMGNNSLSSTATYLTVMTPCIANKKVYINVVCTSLSFAVFIPCLGNI